MKTSLPNHRIDVQDFVYKSIEDQLLTLRNILREFEYTSGYYQRLAEGYGFIHAPRKTLAFGNPITELLLDFFADNRALSLKEINTIFPKNLRADLLQAQLIIKTLKGEFLSVFRVFPLNHYLLLVPFPRFSDPQVYLGAESLTFQKYLRVVNTPKAVLDLATGSGFQLFGLPWQGPSYSMLGIDLNPNAIATAKLSASWNQCDWITFKQGDITTDLADISRQFDLITGHLPILPTPSDTRYKDSMHNDGGMDGFAVIRKVLPAIPNILAPEGTAQLIHIALGTDEEPGLLQELRETFDELQLKGQVVVIKKIPVELDAYYRGTTEEEYTRWINFYKRQKASYWYRIILRISHSTDYSFEPILNYLELFRHDFSQPPNPLSLEKIRRDMNHYLNDFYLLSNSSRADFDICSSRLEKAITNPDNFRKTITEFGKELGDTFSDIFPNVGSAIRFWGKLSANQWQPRYLERKLW
ncbi:MAG: methyltransferase domain-containing protein [Candidatus Heimdallarchaeota archaeon]